MKIHGQGHVVGQKLKSWSGSNPLAHLRPGVQSMCLLFVSWQSDHVWLRYSKFHIWPWKLKVKVMAKVTPGGHIWCIEFNRYVCFSFRGNRTIFGWDRAIFIFDLENSSSRSWPRSIPMVTFEPRSSIDMFAFRFKIFQIPYLTLKIQGQGHDEYPPKSKQSCEKMKKIPKLVQKLLRKQESAVGVGVWTGTKS